MNCLFLLVLLCCCGNNGARTGNGNQGCGCRNGREGRQDMCRESRQERCPERRMERDNGGCGRQEGRQQMRYDDQMRGCPCADTVPEMRNQDGRPYPMYPDNCGCGDRG